MWPAAEILPIPVPVHANRLIVWDGFDEFNLVGFVEVPVVLDGATPLPDFGAHRLTLRSDLPHALLNEFQVDRRE